MKSLLDPDECSLDSLSLATSSVSSVNLSNPFAVPDILLHVVDFVLLDASSPAERWYRLAQITLVNKLARDILTAWGVLWRWVDLRVDEQYNLHLMLKRTSGKDIRPVVVAEDLNNHQNFAKLRYAISSFQCAVPPLRPEALCLRIRDSEWQSVKEAPHWRGLRFLAVDAVLPHGFHWQDAIDAFVLDLDEFPNLERVSLKRCLPARAKRPCPTITHFRIDSCPMMPLNLQSADWASALDYLPNLRVLFLHTVPVAGIRFNVELPHLEEIFISNVHAAHGISIKSPVLKRATFRTGGSGWWSERQMIHPVALNRMVSEWPALEELNLLGPHQPKTTRSGWNRHLLELRDLPSSLRSLFVRWEVPIGAPNTISSLQCAATVRCLQEYKKRHGTPLQSFTYAVLHGLPCPGSVIFEDLVVEYHIVEGSDEWATDTAHSATVDQHWKLSGCVLCKPMTTQIV